MSAPGEPDGSGGPDGAALGDAVLAREPGALERAVALATSADAAHRASARAAVDAWARRTGKSLRVGLTGGAASAADALARRLGDTGHRVAVLRVGAASGPASGTGPTAGTDVPFAATLPPDGAGAPDAIRACEIAGHDVVLVAADDAASVALGATVDCRVGDGGDAEVALEGTSLRTDAGLDATWARVRRWHWDAVEDGRFVGGRRAQQRFRDGAR